jgi:hypothetical protein
VKNKAIYTCTDGVSSQIVSGAKKFVDVDDSSKIKKGGGSWILFQKQIEPYHVSFRRTQRHLAEYNRKYIFIVIYDEMESNLVKINVTVIRCKSIIMQMNTSA